MEAVRVDDGAVTFSVSVPVTAAVPVTFMARGFGEQVTPGGNPAVGQVTLTLPVNPPVGVTVIVDVPLDPAVAVTALPPMVKLPVVPPLSVRLKFKTLLPPNAIGFGSAGPNELTMM